MTTTRRGAGVTVLLVVLACVYVAAFIPANRAGAKDLNMVGSFSLDEWVLFPSMTYMLRGGHTVVEALAHFAVPHFWAYGYPFFFTSAAALIPVRLLSDPSNTTLYLLVLRELSPVFLGVAIALLCYMHAGVESPATAAVLFIFLGLVPAVLNLSLWWHPDALAILFVVLTIFALHRDNLSFGRWFYVAAACCGLATGTKLAGVWFFLSIAVYLALGLRTIGVAGVLRHACGFVAVMIAAVVISNPLIVWPRFTRMIVAGHLAGVLPVFNGSGLRPAVGPAAWSTTVRDGFGGWLIIGLGFAACVAGLASDPRKRVLHAMTLTWALPLSIWLLFFAGSKAERYLALALLPVLASFGSVTRRTVPSIALLVLLSIQSAVYVSADARRYREMANREADSPNINFYRALESSYLTRRPAGGTIRVFRDPYVYVPPSSRIDAHFVWRPANYDDLRQLDPDLVILQQDYIALYSAAGTADAAIDTAGAQASRPLYDDAKHDRVAGYRKIVETPFAVAFARLSRD